MITVKRTGATVCGRGKKGGEGRHFIYLPPSRGSSDISRTFNQWLSARPSAGRDAGSLFGHLDRAAVSHFPVPDQRLTGRGPLPAPRGPSPGVPDGFPKQEEGLVPEAEEEPEPVGVFFEASGEFDAVGGVVEVFGGEVALGAVLGDDVGQPDDQDGARESGPDAPVVHDAVFAVVVALFEIGVALVGGCQ